MHNFDRAASIYDSTRSLPDSVMNAVVDAISAELRGSRLVLDAGVGTGRFAGPLRNRGLAVVGLDVSRAMLSEARRKSAADLVRGELLTMPFVNGAFDSCLMIHVLHLVESPTRLLSEIGRVCKSKVLSLAESSDYISVRENYIRLLTQAGYSWGDLSEQKLTTIVAPTLLKEVISYPVVRKADDDIEYFRNRMSAVTWDVPAEVHERIIRELSSSLGGRVFSFRTTVRLAKWSAVQLRDADLGSAR